MIELQLNKIVAGFLSMLMLGFAGTDMETKSKPEPKSERIGESIIPENNSHKMIFFGNFELIKNGVLVAQLTECFFTLQAARRGFIVWSYKCRIASFGWKPGSSTQDIFIFLKGKEENYLQKIKFEIPVGCKTNKQFFKRGVLPASNFKFRDIKEIYIMPANANWRMCKEI